MTWWLVEASASTGGRWVLVQPIALTDDGTRLPLMERNGQRLFHQPPAQPALTAEQRAALFTQAEQTLQRELHHKGLATGSGAYAAELVGYVEIATGTGSV